MLVGYTGLVSREWGLAVKKLEARWESKGESIDKKEKGPRYEPKGIPTASGWDIFFYSGYIYNSFSLSLWFFFLLFRNVSSDKIIVFLSSAASFFSTQF